MTNGGRLAGRQLIFHLIRQCDEMGERDFSWLTKAKCYGLPPERYFTKTTSRRIARELCEGCPVIDECLDYAIATRVPGVWGGTTANERDKMRKAAQ